MQAPFEVSIQCFNAHLLAPLVPGSLTGRHREVSFSLPILLLTLDNRIEHVLFINPAETSKQTNSAHSSAP